MNTTSKSSQEGGSPLTIGELAEQAGVSASTLRMWETRHGFPHADRLPSGHRRYAAAQVALVREVARRRDEGTRLDAAIQQVTQERSTPRSVYAELTRQHPEQPRQRLTKGTLLALSWAIEDEIAAWGSHGLLFGAFQEARHFDSARPRWHELARTTRETLVFADFEEAADEDDTATYERVHLAAGAPMRREWNVVNDSAELPVALTAWELPGQLGTPDRLRLFEAVWTLDPAAVRTAARCCATIAADAGHASGARLVDGPLAGPPLTSMDAMTVTRIAHRTVAYVDHVLTAAAVV